MINKRSDIMNRMIMRMGAFLLAVMLCLNLCIPAMAAEREINATILFTNDLHSHLLPSSQEGGEEYGGYGRLMTVIRQQIEKYPDAILVDGGDFSMGSLFQTAYTTSALELRIMGAMGYDATVFGNHEFDYLPKGLASMLNAAVASGDALPAIVNANYLPPEKGSDAYTEDTAAVVDAFENYGVKEYVILERGGVYFAIIGLFGVDADACAPNSGMILHDIAEKAQQAVDAATAECKQLYGAEPVVVALSHTGTDNGQGEDYELAMAVDGIDVIISGHTHTLLEEAIVVNNTYIVSAAEYGKYLGVVHLRCNSAGATKIVDYELIPIDETVEEDAEIGALVENFKVEVEKNYLADYGMGFDQVLLTNDYEFDKVRDVYDYAHESTLCNVFSDAYKWAVEQTTGEKVDVALTASGVIRESIPMGEVTVSDIFNAASLGVGTEGELVQIYLTGADLMSALEVDASVYPLMHSAQLFYSGVEYSFNTNRMIFNKIDYAMLRNADGTLSPIEEKRMYSVVCGMYMAQMLGSVESTSMGLVSIVPRNAYGDALTVEDLSDYVVRDEADVPMKEWYAIASYLDQMEGDVMDPQYGQVDGRKVVYSSLNPAKLLRNANMFTYILLAVLAVLLAVILLTVRGVKRLVKRTKNKKNVK